MSRSAPRPPSLAERIYARLKGDIFEFGRIPGARFSEGAVAERMSASRTPVRQALHRLQREGFLDVHFRSGWLVRPLDFAQFDELYELRILLELDAVRRLCQRPSDEQPPALQALARTWMVRKENQLQDGSAVSRLDEAFHCQLLEAAGNREMARVHREVSEKIRILRRLDFTQARRIELTYAEHGQILEAILTHRSEEAQQLLKSHIEVSQAEVHSITLHKLYAARQRVERMPE